MVRVPGISRSCKYAIIESSFRRQTELFFALNGKGIEMNIWSVFPIAWTVMHKWNVCVYILNSAESRHFFSYPYTHIYWMFLIYRTTFHVVNKLQIVDENTLLLIDLIIAFQWRISYSISVKFSLNFPCYPFDDRFFGPHEECIRAQQIFGNLRP